MIFIREEEHEDAAHDYYCKSGWSFLIYRNHTDEQPYARFYGMSVGDLGFYAHFDILEGEHNARDVAAAILHGMQSMEERNPPLIFTKTKQNNKKILRLCKMLGFDQVNIKFFDQGERWITLCKNFTTGKNKK